MNRVVITGMGVISPIGNNVQDFCASLRAGTVGLDKITRIDPETLPIHILGEVKNFNPEPYVGKKEQKRLDLFSQYAVCAAGEAYAMSGLADYEAFDKKRFGVILGSGIGGFSTLESEIIRYSQKGRIAPLFIPMSLNNMAAGNVAISVGAKGICTAVITACATGTHSIGEAFRNIKHGYADVILAGGTEAGITTSGIVGFNAIKTLSLSEDKYRASIPFDKERNGFVMGEGAGVLVLEELTHAQKRGAQILGEVVGYGATCDAYHMTAPDPDGAGASDAMALAMSEAGIEKEQVGYINAHGTSTELNDLAESRAIRRTFGDYADKLPVSSTKSMTGHLLGAAGGAEGAAVVLALKEGFLPANVGLKVKDEECQIHLIEETVENSVVDYALSNSFGFGGHNAVVCFRRWECE